MSVLGEKEHAAGVLHGTKGEFCHWQKKKYISFSFADLATGSNDRQVRHKERMAEVRPEGLCY